MLSAVSCSHPLPSSGRVRFGLVHWLVHPTTIAAAKSDYKKGVKYIIMLFTGAECNQHRECTMLQLKLSSVLATQLWCRNSFKLCLASWKAFSPRGYCSRHADSFLAEMPSWFYQLATGRACTLHVFQQCSPEYCRSANFWLSLLSLRWQLLYVNVPCRHLQSEFMRTIQWLHNNSVHST